MLALCHWTTRAAAESSRARDAQAEWYSGGGYELTPWLELLANGTFSASTLKMTPTNFEVSDGWLAVLTKSLNEGPETWLHHLFLGTHALVYLDLSLQLVTLVLALLQFLA